jgi:hypothetical protein
MLTTILSAVIGIGQGWFSDWQARREEQRKIESAVAENKIRLALSEQEHNQQWEMAALEGRDNWLRRISFALWTWPLVWAFFSPGAARVYFSESLAGLPEWYVAGYLAMTGAVWGVSELKAAGVFKK